MRTNHSRLSSASGSGVDCRACGAATQEFLSLGQQPLPNRFLTEAQLAEPEPKYPLGMYFCPGCTLVQLGTVVPPEDLFFHYLFASSTSPLTRAHFTGLAAHLKEMFHLDSDSKVVDIASNDGVLLRAFSDLGVQAIGVEPAENLCRLARNEGLPTINGFFTAEVVQRLGPGSAHVVTACNVFAHVPDPLGFCENVKRLLRPDGVFVVEVQYLRDMLTELHFDNIYAEHICYFTLTSLDWVLAYAGLHVFDAERINTHGGSLRVYAHKLRGAIPGRNNPTRLSQLRREEMKMGLNRIGPHRAFATRVEQVKENVPKLLSSLDGRIIGYGAAAKATTLLNYCNIGPETISYIVDDSPLKQGRYLPGMHIPIVGPEMLTKEPPAYIILLAWNHGQTIMKKTRHLRAKYILPVPPRLLVV